MKKFTALKHTREQAGKTQAQVAREAKMATRIYQNYEYGTNLHSIQNAIKIARAVGTTVEEIWGYETPSGAF